MKIKFFLFLLSFVLLSFLSNSQCLNSANLTANPMPVGGSYNPGQTVQFCYTVSQWTQTSTNWFHGVQISFGSGWTGGISNAVPAATCQALGGSWGFYPSGLTNGWGTGFYFLQPGSGNPANNFGDDCGGAVNWTFCWELTVGNSCGDDLTVTVNTSGDGESGSWVNLDCVSDQSSIINATVASSLTGSASSNSPLCVGDNLNLSALSSDPSATYNWTGPNGFSSNLQNPSIANVNGSHAGTYTVVISANGCSVTETVNVVITDIPNLYPTYNSPLCEGDNLNLSCQSVSGATYTWTGPNGFYSTSQNPTVYGVTQLDAGYYQVTATVNGCSATFGVNVVINPAPIQNVWSNAPICEGDLLQLFSDYLVGATYQWSGPNGFFSTQQNPTIPNVSIAYTGMYSLTTTVNGCSSTESVFVIINPTPYFTLNSNSPICEGDYIDIYPSVFTADTYTWTGPNGYYSTLSSVFILNATSLDAGTYVLEISVDGCTYKDSIDIVVTPKPTVVANGNSPLCEGDNLNLTASNLVGGVYSWVGPSGYTANLQNPSLIGVSSANSGNYIVTVDVNGCEAKDTVQIIVNDTPNVVISNNSPLCEGNTLVFNVTTIPGAVYQWTGPNGFASNQQNPQIVGVSSLNSGVYSLMVMNNGCASTFYSNVVINTSPDLSPTATVNVCEGDTIFLDAIFNPSVTYNWSGPNGFTSNIRNPFIAGATGLNSGWYKLTSSYSGCIRQDSVLVNVLSNSSLGLSINNPVCEGGSLNLGANYFAGGIYNWTGPNGFSSNLQNPVINGVTIAASGFYVLEVTANGCISKDSILVSISPLPIFQAQGSLSVCEDDTIFLWTNYLVGDNYQWTGPNGFSSNLVNPFIPNSSVINAGKYYLTVTKNGCSSIDSVDIQVKAKVALLAIVNSPVCEGDSIVLDCGSFAGASSYSWSGPNGFSSNIKNPIIYPSSIVNAGDYYLEVVIDGCVNYDTVSVQVNPIPSLTLNANSPICEGDSLRLYSNFMAGAIYNWSGPNGFVSNAQNPFVYPTSLSDNGTYLLSVQVNGCTNKDSIQITIKPNPQVNISTNSPICLGDTIFINGNLIPIASYSWTGPNGFNSTQRVDTIINAIQQDSGYYVLEVTVNGCSAMDSAFVKIKSLPPIVASSNSAICEGDTLKLYANSTPTAVYSWVGPNGFTSNLQNPILLNSTIANTGNYIVTCFDNGCYSYDTIQVFVNPNPTVSITGNNILCVSNTLTLNGNLTVGVSYSWLHNGVVVGNNQNFTINNIATSMSGKYYLEVVSVDGCFGIDSVDVVVDSILNITASSNSPVCEGDSIKLFSTGLPGATYSWRMGGANVSSIQNPIIINSVVGQSGNYIVEVNSSGCLGFDTVQVLVKPNPIVTGVSNSPVCEGGILSLVAGGTTGVMYEWYNSTGLLSISNSTTVNNIVFSDSGYYWVEGTLNGCKTTDSLWVDVYGLPNFSLSSNSPVCENDTLYIGSTVVLGASYQWVGPSGFNSNQINDTIVAANLLDSGMYYLTVTKDGCSKTDSILIDVNALPIAIATSNSSICDGDTLALFANSVTGGNYQWTNSGIFNSNLQNPIIPTATLSDSGYYYLEVEKNGCFNYDTALVDINPIPLVTLNTNSPICEKQSITIGCSGYVGASYLWTGPNGYSSLKQNDTLPSASIVKQGWYYLTTSLNGCSYLDSVFVKVDTITNATIIPTGPFCANASNVSLIAVNPGGIWGGQGVIDPTAGGFSPVVAGGGIHTVTYQTIASCPDTQSTNIQVYDTVVTPITIDNPEGCSPLSVRVDNLDSLNSINCVWYSNGNVLTDDCNGFSHLFSEPGCYDIVFERTDGNGCKTKSTYNDTICVYPLVFADFTYPNREYTVMQSTVNFINQSVNAVAYKWLFNWTDTSVAMDTSYRLPDVPGVYDVCLEAYSSLGCYDSICKKVTIVDAPYFYVPNAFTPNNDGFNEEFKPIISAYKLEEYRFYIFNRSGTVIYETDREDLGWDGTYKGEICKEDVYVWKVVYKTADDIEVKEYIGHFSLLK